MRLRLNASPKKERPVTLPPGRAKLLTNPRLSASPMAAITIGIVRVAPMAARTPGVE